MNVPWTFRFSPEQTDVYQTSKSCPKDASYQLGFYIPVILKLLIFLIKENALDWIIFYLDAYMATIYKTNTTMVWQSLSDLLSCKIFKSTNSTKVP